MGCLRPCRERRKVAEGEAKAKNGESCIFFLELVSLRKEWRWFVSFFFSFLLAFLF